MAVGFAFSAVLFAVAETSWVDWLAAVVLGAAAVYFAIQWYRIRRSPP
jgi:hypothetical protein